jgi:hypothetical protein
VGIGLCLPVFSPGVVDEANLDARPVNAIACAGVLVALGLSLRFRVDGWSRDVRGDGYRDLVGTLAVLAALPWIFAELGFFLDRVPLLDRIFETGAYRARGAEVAVHHGHHHGLDGLLLLLTAILLSRVVPEIRGRALRLILAAYLSLMAAYGLGNMANDFWTEQIWKRGWTNWRFPDLLQPSLSVGWGLMVVGAALLLAMSIEAPRSRMGRIAQQRR